MNRTANALVELKNQVALIYSEAALEPNLLYLSFLDTYQKYRGHQFEQAAVEFLDLLGACEREGELVLAQYLRVHLGTLCSLVGDYQQALTYLLEAQSQQDIEDAYFESLLNTNLAAIYSQLGDYEMCADIAKSAITTLHQINDPSSLSLCYLNYGRSKRELGELEEAELWLNESIALSQTHSFIRNLGFANLYLALVEKDRDVFHRASQLFKTSYDTFVQQRDGYGIAESSYLYAQFLFDSQHYHQAIELCDKVIASKQIKDHAKLLFGLYSVLKSCHQRLKEWDDIDRVSEEQIGYAESELERFKSQESQYFQANIKRVREYREKVNQEELLKHLSSITLLGQKIATSTNLADDIVEVFYDIQTLFPSTFFSIGLYDASKNELNYRFTVDDGYLVEPKVVRCESNRGVGAYCCRTKKTVLINTGTDEEVASALGSNLKRNFTYKTASDHNTNSVLFTPIILKEELLGIVTVQHHEAYKYKTYHRQLLEQFAQYLAIALQNLRQQQILVEQQKQLQQSNIQLNHLAMTDPLTGLLNRLQLENSVTRLCDEQVSVGLIMIDVDFYKEYNDTYGHDAGDTVLKHIARVLEDACKHTRASIFRYGGDEFFILLERVEPSALKGIAKDIQLSMKRLRFPHKLSEVSDSVTLTLGLSLVKLTSRDDLSSVISLVDGNLYLAKRHRRGSMAFNGVVIAEQQGEAVLDT